MQISRPRIAVHANRQQLSSHRSMPARLNGRRKQWLYGHAYKQINQSIPPLRWIPPRLCLTCDSTLPTRLLQACRACFRSLRNFKNARAGSRKKKSEWSGEGGNGWHGDKGSCSYLKRSVWMMTSSSWFSCILIVRYLPWLMNCRSPRVRSDTK